VDKYFVNVELKAMNTMEQPTLDQRIIKSTKTQTPIEILPQIKGNELKKPLILFFFLFFFLFLFLNFIFFLFFLIFYLFFSSGKEKLLKAHIHE